MQKIAVIAAARPNFMKVAPLLHAFKARNVPVQLVHTGQHYDKSMSDVFFEELEIPRPDFHLGVGSGSHAAQTAGVMVAFEQYCEKEQPDWVVVVGDVNSTLACSLVASKLGIKVCHIEAGLRSGDWSMPEEINRVLTDRLSDLLLIHSREAEDNLLKEGIAKERIVFTGNVMIDTLFQLLPKAKTARIRSELGLEPGSYILATFHRPVNVDSAEALGNLVSILLKAANYVPVVFPVHPRTRTKLKELNLADKVAASKNLMLIDPLGYIDFLALNLESRIVMTDSGGIQEETTALGIPCLTLRENTERPVTVTHGTNEIVGTNYDRVVSALERRLAEPRTKKAPPEYWDGHAAERCVEELLARM